MRKMVLVFAGIAIAATAYAANKLETAQRAYETYAVPTGVQGVCEAGKYACIEEVLDDGTINTVCGTVTLNETGEPEIPYNDCIDQGGTICTYPWDPGQYCCGIVLGAPPAIN